MLGRLGRGYDRLIDAMAVVAGAGMALMALWITYEVITRYFFNNPTVWATDLSEYMLLYGTFLAGPWLVREDGHITIDLLLTRLTPRQRHVLGAVSALIGAAVMAVLCWQGLEATLDAFTRGQMIAKTWRVPRAAVWAVIPFGSFFLVVEFIRAAVRSVHASRDELALSRQMVTEERGV